MSMYENEQKLIRSAQPSYFPNLFSNKLANWIDEVERMFKEPIKNVFPDPMNIIKTYDEKTKNLKSLSFYIALAGIPKEGIKVQLKKGKILTVSVDPFVNAKEEIDDNSEIVVNGICSRQAEISFKIFFEVDTEKFKPTFKDGLLSVELFVKEPTTDNDVITANIE